MFVLGYHRRLDWLASIMIEQCKLGRILGQSVDFGMTFIC